MGGFERACSRNGATAVTRCGRKVLAEDDEMEEEVCRQGIEEALAMVEVGQQSQHRFEDMVIVFVLGNNIMR